MLFVNDPLGQTIYNGAEWPSLTGQALKDSLGRRWLERIHVDDRNMVEDIHTRAIEQGFRYEIRYRLLRPDDSCRWVCVGARPSYGPSGQVLIGFLGSMSILSENGKDTFSACGTIERCLPQALAGLSSADERLNRAADHLLMAVSLIDGCPLPALSLSMRISLLQLGDAMAAIQQHRDRLN